MPNAVATLSRGRETLVLKVVNPTAEEVACSIEIDAALKPKRGRQWVVSAGLEERNTLQEPDRVAPVETQLENASNDFVHPFPAHSVTVMELRS